MANILFIEPDYRSKFPPLGLLKLATYHKSKGDDLMLFRGTNPVIRTKVWDRIYVSTLFTWELPRAVNTVKYYSKSVSNPKDIFVGGVAATLYPQYLADNLPDNTLIIGQLDKPDKLEPGAPPIAELLPDYNLLKEIDYNYFPNDAYFARITKGCIRSCKFCAVPILETEFGYLNTVASQVVRVKEQFGEKQHLVVMDNNILGIEDIDKHLDIIASIGFEKGAIRNGRKRYVDFNQGLDARLIAENPILAKQLSKICLSPVRLAFDFYSRLMRKAYTSAIEVLVENGFREFTNYLLFNFNDNPSDLWERFMINYELNERLGITITGFPMRFIPMDDVKRNHVSKFWKWRYLRGMQCVLLATHGMVSPKPDFVQHAFGSSFDEFIEILSMPDRYIIFRKDYADNEALDWKGEYRKLSESERNEFMDILGFLNNNRNRASLIPTYSDKYRSLLHYYYPDGRTAPQTPRRDILAQQGVSVGYD